MFSIENQIVAVIKIFLFYARNLIGVSILPVTIVTITVN